MNPVEFQLKLLDWFDRHGRKDLPWQQHISPYRVWVSEIMLQQTQVSAVEPYFEKFMRTFPDVHALANATSDDVLVHWAGLGYYARARNLHRAAQVIVQQGCFPDTVEDLVKLPGIGRSTAGAIVSIACKKFAPILDGNVKRVLSRFLAIEGWPGKADVAKRLWAASERFSPESRTADYTQAIMDLGATLCTKSQPGCQVCPLAKSCQAHLNDNVAAYPARKKPNPFRCGNPAYCWRKLQVNRSYWKKNHPAAFGAAYGVCRNLTMLMGRWIGAGSSVTALSVLAWEKKSGTHFRIFIWISCPCSPKLRIHPMRLPTRIAGFGMTGRNSICWACLHRLKKYC